MRLDSLEAIAREIERVATSHAGFSPDLLATRANRDGLVLPLGTPDPGGEVEPRAVEPASESGVSAVMAHAGNEDIPASADAVEDEAPVVDLDDPSDEGEDATGEHHVRPAMLGVPDAPSTATVKPDGYRLRLSTSRTLYDRGTLVANSPHLAVLGPPLLLHCHPSDLTRFSLREGASVKVTSSRSSMTLPITADASVPRGACWLPWNAGTPGAGDLIDSSVDVCDLSVEQA
jgi:anaerobic selenocysteine-containing dehydrogenase